MRTQKDDGSLSVQFTLLPSMLPNGALTPLLFSVWRGIAVYRTLDPSPSSSYISMSALSMALEIPALHLLYRFHLRPGFDFDMTLGGVAPWRDLWVNFAVARRIMNKLGHGSVFGANDHASRISWGLLSRETENAVSWDDGDGGIAHNWLPPSQHVPLSSYSLAVLTDTPFPSIHVLANDRFVRTPLDKPTRKLLASKSRLEDDWTGLGCRRFAFHDALELSVAAWERFLRYPSVPPAISKEPRKGRDSTTPAAIYSLVQSLPRAVANINITSSFPLILQDIESIMQSASTSTMTTRKAVKQLLETILDDLAVLRPLQAVLGTPHKRAASRDTRKLEAFARVQLAFAEALGWTLVAAWRADTGEVVESVKHHHEDGLSTDTRFNSEQNPRVATLVELESERRSSPPPRAHTRSPSGNRLHSTHLNDVPLHSEEGSLWLWAGVAAFMAFCIWAARKTM